MLHYMINTPVTVTIVTAIITYVIVNVTVVDVVTGMRYGTEASQRTSESNLRQTNFSLCQMRCAGIIILRCR